MSILTIAGAALASGPLAAAASAGILFDTGEPQSGFIGYYGFDLLPSQSVAIAFTPDQDSILDSVGLWMMSNDFDNAGRAFTVSVRTDAAGGMTIPGDTVIESWATSTTAVGWSPVLDEVTSLLNPVLEAGVTYWIVAESVGPIGLNPVWVASQQDEPVWHSVKNALNPDFAWISGYGNGVPGLVVSGRVVPAPGVVAMLSIGGLLGARRRR
jgi:hypothetical protein